MHQHLLAAHSSHRRTHICFCLSCFAPVNEVDSVAFQCIICSESFLTRNERNEHLERHFVHRKCGHCDKSVIAIGDLDFELHRPVHCRTINDTCKSESSRSQNISVAQCIKRLSSPHNSDADVEFIENDEEIAEQKFCEIHVVSGFKSDVDEEVVSSTRKSRRRRTKINYDENNQTREIVEQKVNQKKSPSKKSASKQEPNSEDKDNSDVIELLDFGNEGSTRDEEEEEGEGIVFDMKFEELGGDDSEVDEDRHKLIDSQRPWGSKSKLHPKNIPCPDCKMMFRADRTLKTHRKREHGYVQKNICSICAREFKDAGNLNQHMHTHGDSKRYICNFCGKGFHMPYNLKEHMHQHTGERPYKCSVCEKTFNRQTLRNAHMRVSNQIALRTDGCALCQI